MEPFGTHILVELSQCENITEYDDSAKLEALLSSIVEQVGLTAFAVHSHKFQPQGITAFVGLEESHVSVHIFTEIGYASFDIYTCAKTNEPKTAEAARLFIQALGSRVTTFCHVNRGTMTGDNSYGFSNLRLWDESIS